MARTFAALVALAVAATAAYVLLARAQDDTRAGRLDVDSRFVGRTLEQRTIDSGRGRPLLVLLHGRRSSPESFLTEAFERALEALGQRAPSVVLVDGGDHSYYHDRRDGRWGSYVLREAIPAAARALRTNGRVAIGGFSMGGFGALDLARISGRFCAVGGHAPALWRTGGETPAGAFDDAEDFARHDLFAEAGSNPRLFGRARVWLDVGRDDPFHDATVAFARQLRSQGQPVSLHVWPGGHSHEYVDEHVDEYLRFYADALARC